MICSGPKYQRASLTSIADYTTADLAYIFRNYRTLEEICTGREEVARARTLIAQGLLPGPSYPLDGEDGLFPADYFELVDEAGGVARLRRYFADRYRLAGGREDELDEDWQGYLAGLYGVCLRRVTPETIVRKGKLTEAIERLLALPRPDERDWCEALRESVNALDGLERPFAPDFDRNGRFPTPPSRDRLIAFSRRSYPEAFGDRRSVHQPVNAASRVGSNGETASVEPGSPGPQ